jgi:peptidoglycan/LPS O-acetylase OafA/YrhL
MTTQAVPSQRRYEELESYRGIAALLIVLFHVYQYTREGPGAADYLFEGTLLGTVLFSLQMLAALFFTLSGFVVFLPFARAAMNQSRRYSLRGFMVRRFVRIVPAYYVVVILVWTLRYAGMRENWEDLLLHLTFTHVFSSQYIFWTVGPTWALAIEVLFYLFLLLFGPFIYWLGSQFATRKQRALSIGLCVGSLGIASLLYKHWAFYLAQIPEDAFAVYFGPLAKLDSFVLGMLLAVIVSYLGDRPLLSYRSALILRLTGFAGIVALALTGQAIGLYFHTLFSVAFTLIVASTALAPVGSSFQRLMHAKPLLTLGLISYSLYLWHEPILRELGARSFLISQVPEAFMRNVLILLPLALLAATVSYWMIEFPASHLGYLFDREGRLIDPYAEAKLQQQVLEKRQGNS